MKFGTTDWYFEFYWQVFDCYLVLFVESPSAGSPPQQRLQPLAGHVVGGSHRIRLTVRHLSLQRGRGHQRADTKRSLHVPPDSVEGDLR